MGQEANSIVMAGDNMGSIVSENRVNSNKVIYGKLGPFENLNTIQPQSNHISGQQ